MALTATKVDALLAECTKLGVVAKPVEPVAPK